MLPKKKKKKKEEETEERGSYLFINNNYACFVFIVFSSSFRVVLKKIKFVMKADYYLRIRCCVAYKEVIFFPSGE